MSQDSSEVKSPNFTDKFAFSTKISLSKGPYVSLPSLNPSQALDAFKDKKQDFQDAVKVGVGRNWYNVFQQGADLGVFESTMMPCVNRDSSQWVQQIEHEGHTLGPRYITPNLQGVKLSGEAAVARIRQVTSGGDFLSIPLWHSGFYINLKTPRQADLLELQRIIEETKSKLGHETYGRIYSNYTYYMVQALLEFIEKHIHSSTLKLSVDKKYIDFIKVTDIPIAIAGLASVIWQKGFDYKRACLSSPGKCFHVVEELLNIVRLIRVDQSLLTARQLRHMCNNGSKDKMSEEQVTSYCDEFTHSAGRVVALSEKISIELKTPSAQKYINAGHRWVTGIESTYTKALIEDIDARASYLTQQAHISAMREYAHYVSKIIIHNDDGSTQEFITDEDEDTVNLMLDELSGVDDIRVGFLQNIKTFINDTTIAVIAIPTYECPECHGKQLPAEQLTRFPELIVLDPLAVFFTLLSRTVQYWLNRD